MGRSIGRPTGESSGSFFHPASGSFFSISATGDSQIQRLRRGGIEEERSVAYTIGSGNAAIGYLLRIDDRLFQSPVTFYAATARFGIAPGMENLTDPDFLRPVGAECLWCHAGQPSPVLDTLNRFADPPFEVEAISCERCHGPSEAHLERPSRETILNPAELPGPQRDSICEQCHLSGIQRVLNPGREVGDFQPGMTLEEVLTVFVPLDDPEEFKVVSHAEQLVRSKCFRLSKRQIWCGTCHNPHDPPGDPRAAYVRKCQTCHTDLGGPEHIDPAGGCVSCHMARRQSRDSGHSAFTDHRIAARPYVPAAAKEQPQQGRQLQAWREPGAEWRDRNLGIAYAREAETSGSRPDRERSLRLLSAVEPRFPVDPDVLGGLGMALLLSGSERRGIEKLERAIAAEPANPLRYPPVAAAWWQLGDEAKAMDTLRSAIRTDPYYLPAYRMLAHILAGQGQAAEARKVWETYLRYVPQSMNARLALEAHER